MRRRVVILGYPKVHYESNYRYSWIPYSILGIAGPLLGSGIEVLLFDGNRQPESDWVDLLDEYAKDALCIGLSAMTGGGQICEALQLAKLARNRGDCPPIVFGGPHANVLPKQTCEHPLVDVVLAGPGQMSLSAYVDTLRGSQRQLESVPGLLTMIDGNWITGTPNSSRIPKVGGYPWHLLNLEAYIQNEPILGQRTLNYISSQGCVYKCRFCYETTYHGRYSAAPACSVLHDVEHLVSTHGIDGLKIYDADFFIDLRRVRTFAEGLSEKGMRLQWAAAINPNDVMRAIKQEPDLLELVAKSGCTRLLMGMESGSDRVLRDIVAKETSQRTLRQAARSIAQQGLIGSYTFIVGFPGETAREQEETYELISDLQSINPTPETRVHLYAPYPGTPLFQDALEHGFIPPRSLEEWSEFDYYKSTTPWTNMAMVDRVKLATNINIEPVRDN